MGSKILINATHREEVRIAIIEHKLMEYDHDRLDNVNKKGCIYKGIVSRIEPSLNAAFVNYGEGRHGFLPASEVTSQLYPKGLDRHQKHTIQNLLQKDQEIFIQVEKEEQGNKGAALTTNLSLAGCYVVLMPMTSDSGGISRQIEGEDRDYLQRILNQIDLPENFSVIIRTASIGRSLEELLWDFNVLKSQWEAISQYASEHEGPHLLYKDGDLLSRVIRDYLKPSVEEILIDDPFVYQEVLKLVQHIRPDFLSLVKYFDATKGVPLFAQYQIEHEIESIFNPEIVLENGSTLIFDHREALTSIDINSARSTTSSDITTTAFKTNLTAATEIARQIRLRNIGGQIIIDFIHMSSSDQSRQSDQARQVEAALKQGLSGDKARIQIGKISKLGLLEISRQRLKTALDKSQLMTCQNCHGRGTHRQPQSVALSILRLIEQEAIHYRQGVATVHVHPTIAGYLFNTYRQALCDLEKRSFITVQILSDALKSAGDYEMNFYGVGQDLRHPERTIRNYIPSVSTPIYVMDHAHAEKKSGSALPYTTLQLTANPRQGSFFSKIWKFFFGSKVIKSRIPASLNPTENRVSDLTGSPTAHTQSSHGNRRRDPRQERQERGESRYDRSERSPRNERSDRPAREAPERVERSTEPTPNRAPRGHNPNRRPTSAVEEPAAIMGDPADVRVTPPGPVKKRPAKRPPAPLTESLIIQPLIAAVPELVVSPRPIVPAVHHEIDPEGEAVSGKKPSQRRRHHRRGPAKNSSSAANNGGTGAPASE